MIQKRFYLIDCNNFFVSCERLFNPKLLKKPVAILSSNDGCVIARSNEVKALGIPMGAPAYSCKDIFKKHNVFIYSSNFSLYADLSSRVMNVLMQYVDDIEIYSIDEAFLSIELPIIASSSNYFYNFGQFLKQQVEKCTGIPISIGIGPTKTLAKVANKISKKDDTRNGVFDITDQNIDDVLSNVKVEDVWNIGRRYTSFLKSKQIFSAKDFKYADEAMVKKRMTINGLKTLYEIRGNSCLELNDVVEPKQSITVSRSFGVPIRSLKYLKEALSTHASAAAEKLRDQKSVASCVSIFLITTRYHNVENYYDTGQIELSCATSYTPDIIKAAHECLDTIYKQDFVYKKIGITLLSITSADFIQLNLYDKSNHNLKNREFIKSVDQVNKKWGRGAIRFASSGHEQIWKMKQEKRSRAYTTNWDQILTIQI